MQWKKGSPNRIRKLFGVWIQALLFVLFAQCGHAPLDRAGEDKMTPVSFYFIDPGAERVCIAGSFNEWSKEAHCMTREKDRWTVRIYLSPGRCAYLFVIDGRLWLPDPNAPLLEESGFGSKNSIVIVE